MDIKSLVNPKAELFTWGPINGRPIYVSYFMESITKRTHKYYRHKWPNFIFYFVGDKLTFTCEDDKLRERGKKYFAEWILDDGNFNLVKDRYKIAKKTLLTIEEQIPSLDSLDDEEFKKVFLEFHEAYLTFWDHGLVPEIANWGGEVILKDKLSNIAKLDFVNVYEKLCAPSGLSFYQEEEIDLLKVKKGETSLENHQKKYFWIQNSYFETKMASLDFFAKRLEDMGDIDFNEEINRIQSMPSLARQVKEKIINQYNLDQEIQKIAERLSYCIYWQDERKGKIFLTDHYIYLFLQEFSRRFSIPLNYLEQYWCWELPDLFEGNFIDSQTMKNRLIKHAGILSEKDNEHITITDESFDEVVGPFLELPINEDASVINGLSVSLGGGKIRGKVRIMLDAREVDRMKPGEILVAPMTSPEYILAMRKASGIITDVGGMTCHAAIVSRELNIPCIVNTKIATKVLKNGDLIELDPNNSLVKKI